MRKKINKIHENPTTKQTETINKQRRTPSPFACETMKQSKHA